MHLTAEMRAAMVDLGRLRKAYTQKAVDARTAAQRRYLNALHALQVMAPSETFEEAHPPKSRVESD